ncbi:MAG TPA: C4-dicarboxylate ABC transporter substrate-binding protein, partial [Oceanospirillaceae bacterium]|nr:C4-dicarboxylate ABC transporter substrate-binding protein [Oceanospirillaceae bacterium]
MLNLTKKIFTAALISSSIALAGSAMAADFNLRAVANSNENDEDYDGLVVFKDYVEAASNGAISVDLFIGTQLCSNGTECLQAIEDGSVDIYVSTSGGVASTFPYVQMFDLPYVMANDRVAEEVLAGSFVRDLRDQMLADSNDVVRLMTIGNTGG